MLRLLLFLALISGQAFAGSTTSIGSTVGGGGSFGGDLAGSDLTDTAGGNVIIDAANTKEVEIQHNGSEIGNFNSSGFELGAANARVTTILDEDAMGTDSATALATQQSIKAYVDAGGSSSHSDADFDVHDDGDATKKFIYTMDGMTTGTTSTFDINDTAARVRTWQDVAGTVYISSGDDVIVADGGTGVSTLTDGGVMLGSGAGAVTVLGQATNGQLVIGSTGADPVLAAPTGDANEIDITTGGGTLAIGIVSSPTLTGNTTVTEDLQLGDRFITDKSTIALTADDQSVSVAAATYLEMSSDNATAANRTFLLDQGTAGHWVLLTWADTDEGQLVDDAANSDAGNVRLNGNWEPTNLDESVLLYSDGTDWVEIIRFPTTGGAASTAGAEHTHFTAADFYPATTNGVSGLAVQEPATGGDIEYRAFDATTEQCMFLNWVPPKRWDGGTVTAKYYTLVNTASTLGFVMGSSGRCTGDGDNKDVAMGTETTVLDTATGTALDQLVATSPAITLAGSPADGDKCLFKFCRKTGNASDDMGDALWFEDLMLNWTSEASNDD